MALTPAEKQKAFRARKRGEGRPNAAEAQASLAPLTIAQAAGVAAIPPETEVMPFSEVKITPSGPDAAFRTAILALAEDLYARRASNTTWRQELRRAVLASRA